MNKRLRIAILIAFATGISHLLTPHANAQGGIVIASDDFNRSNEAPFAVGGNWGRVIAGNYDGVSGLTNNRVNSVSNEGIYYWQGAGSFDPARQFARQTVVQKDGELGLVLLGGSNQSINVAWGPPGVGNTVYIYWYAGGQDRGLLGTASSSLANGDIIEAALENGVIYARVNGVTVKSVPNTTTLTSGTPGFITYLDPNLSGQVAILDNWQAGTPASFTIGGTITENATGLSGVLVTASGGFSGSATTDVNGAYTITGVPADAVSIVLTPTLSGHTMSPSTRTVPGPVVANVSGEDFTSTLNPGAILTTNATHGSVTRNPDQATYTYGTNVTLTAVPDAGYNFGGWSGDVPVGQEAANPLLVTMSQDRTITATFFAAGVAAADNFDRSDESPLAVGGNWQQPFGGGSANLTGNQVVGATADALYYWQGAGTFSNTRQFARAKVVQPNGQVGLVLLGSGGKALVAAWNSGTLYIYWYTGGSHQGNLATASSTLQAGDVIEAVLDGGTVYAKRNGVVVKSVANTTSLSSGKPGFETYQSGGILDDWEGGIPPAYTISGTITENAAGLSGVLVTASGGASASATTAGDGAYTLSGITPGATSVLLTPTLFGHTMSPSTRTVAGPVAADVSGQDFTSTINPGAILTINAIHGSVTRDPDLPDYSFGAIVTLTPVPDAGHNFVGWSGDVPVGHETDNPLLVTMDQDRTITATFTAPGAVASDDFNRSDESPLAVGGNWQQPFGGGFANLAGNHVLGAAGEALYYWQGAGTFDNARQFARLKVVQPTGQVGLVLLGATNQAIAVAWNAGTLYIYWYSGGTYRGNLTTAPSTLQAGDIIEAVLDAGRVYAKRNGVIVTSAANTTTLSSGKPGFETFLSGGIVDDWEAGTPPAYSISGTITENAAGLSGVLVTATGGFSGTTTTGVDGGYTFSGVPSGVTSVLLTPTLVSHTMSPATRTVVGPLVGDVTGQDFTSTLISNANLTINAVHGSVTKDPDQATYAYGTNVTLTPVPDVGYAFASWSGNVPVGHGTDNPLLVTMDQDRTITANFVATDVVAWDYFDRANESPLAVGGNWQQPFGGGFDNLTGNQVVGASGEALYYWQGAGAFDTTRQFARVRVVQPTGQVGLVLLGASNQALVVAWNAGTLYIYWYSAGAYRGNLTTTSSTLQAGDVIEARLEGGTIYALRNGAILTNVANTTTLSSGRPGFETFQTGAAFDDWQAGPSPSNCSGLPDGTPCNDGENVCTPVDTCQSGVCVGTPLSCNDGNPCTVDSCSPGVGCQQTPGNAGAVCRGSAGTCDVAETCTGSSSVCPVDGFASSATECSGTSQGGACDATDHCSGTANTCVDGFEPSSVTCRPAADGCDVAETCTGTSGVCPVDSQSPAIGVACDGPDSDLCAEGVTVCASGSIVCNDVTGSTIDLCNGLDDDCDAASADGSEDPGVGIACDGPDSDLCAEGVTSCSGGAIVCSDVTGSTLDLCNGLDDDCDAASADGSEDPGVGVACDGPDSDLCAEGVTSCSVGAIVCSDVTGSTLDLCNGLDDDCDAASADGSEDPSVAVACDGPDSDLCAEGTTSCSGGAIVCSDVTGSTLDLCNGLDDDCDAASADGSEDPGVAVACDGPDSDLCAEGVTSCSGGAIVCGDVTDSTLDLCNGLDDDCDAASADGSEDPGVAVACDGPDSDLCAEGTTSCSGGAIVCSDVTGSTLDLCNGLDDDCDAASADGSEDPGVGVACDGPDSDLCAEGVTSCSGGALVCSDVTGSTLDLCNGLDDDCDAASADGAEDPGVGIACDGPDSDLCAEGTTSCSGGAIVCSDVTGSTLDLCNGLDDDCDAASADGSEDPGVAVACDGPDSDLCAEGVTSCSVGAIVCSDVTGNNIEICNGLDDDCDGAIDENGLALCDDGNTCNGIETCGGVAGCQAGTPPVVAATISIPDDVSGMTGTSVSVPILAHPASGAEIVLTMTYDPAVLQPVSVVKSFLTASATLTFDMATPGTVHVSLGATGPILGSGPLAYVNFNIVGSAGSGSALGLTLATIDAGATSTCRNGGRIEICGEPEVTVSGVTVSGKTSTSIAWTKVGNGFRRYDVATGTLNELRNDRSVYSAACLTDDTPNTSTADNRAPTSSGNGYYYLVRQQGVCANGTYGTATNGQHRWSAAACP